MNDELDEPLKRHDTASPQLVLILLLTALAWLLLLLWIFGDG